jgi:DNA-directed RNA polymerase subunit RPC12/RpoP
MNEKCNVRCPKCGSKTLYAYEHIIAESQHKIVDGIWRH